MHSAPSVSYPVGRSRFAAVLLLLAWLLGGIATALWWLQSQSPGWRLGAASLVLAVAGACAAWNWWHSVSGVLAWDGQAWSWGGRQSGVLEVCLDLQHCLLLRWRSGSASEWFWLERAGSTGRWDDLRRAVYSRARPEALPEPRAPAAKP
jgi:hypothetical protein